MQSMSYLLSSPFTKPDMLCCHVSKVVTDPWEKFFHVNLKIEFYLKSLPNSTSLSRLSLVTVWQYERLDGYNQITVLLENRAIFNLTSGCDREV